MHAATIGTMVSLGLLLAAGDAAANHNGNVCRADAASVGIVDRGNFGVHNSSTSSIPQATVYCPIVRDPSAFILQASVYDRSSSADVSCTFLTLNAQGTVVSQQTLTSSGSAPGVQTLTFTPASVTDNMVAVCTIPPAQSGALSHVAAFDWTIP